MTKKAIREMMLTKRDALSPDEVLKKSQALVQIIKASKLYQNAQTVGLFYPMRNEIDLRELLHDHDKTFFFPKVEGHMLQFYEVDNQTAFAKSAFGVLEPMDAKPIDQSIDYLIVPALAISKDKHRIGYGKGFYDRYIESHPHAYTVGVIYDFQEIETMKADAHDQALNDYIKI
ncbi:MAG: 5-formyltetrahydrofolate cyclo-ligase [Acholeplasmataceae bacterium]